MNTLDYILKKFSLSFNDKTGLPIEIPNFGRDQMAELLAEMKFDRGAEIGVAEGQYSEVLCRANPRLKLFGVDPYEPYRFYRDYTRVSTFDRLLTKARERLKPYGDRYEFVMKFSTEAVKDFEDGSLDFVYIDGNHEFSHAAADITQWSRKVRSGGIVYGHDYARMSSRNFNHVFHVVNAYTVAYDIRPWFVLGTNAETSGMIRDEVRSWMWVKT